MIRKVAVTILPITLLALSSAGIADYPLKTNYFGQEVSASVEAEDILNLEGNSAIGINSGMNDAWFNPVTNGQGFFITVFPDIGYVSLAWFTYDTELPPIDATANLGDPGHRWLTAGGFIQDNMVTMNIEMTSGGLFDTASEITRTDPPGSDGTIMLSFSSCNSGVVDYNIKSIDRQGIVNIERVAGDNIALCVALNEAQTPQVCERWNADRADLSEGTWSGTVDPCNAGDISEEGRANALKLINLYRSMVGLSAITTDPALNQKTQECALMMDANDPSPIIHDPPDDWLCYTSEGDSTAGSSNISGGPGVKSIDRYMADQDNASTMGHRRYILSNSLAPKIGLGSTDQWSCMTVFPLTGQGKNNWTAWPSPGKFPVEAFTVAEESIDVTGWTIQSESIDLTDAQVSITDGGANLDVNVDILNRVLSETAIRIVPLGWISEVGHTYKVSVTGIDTPINYEVEVVACQ